MMRTIQPKSFPVPVGCVAILLLLVAVAPAWSQTDPGTLPIPTIDHGSGKFLEAELLFAGDGVTTLRTLVGRGFFRSPVGDPPLLRVEVRDDQGNVVDSYHSWHPLWSHVDDPDGTESMQVLGEGEGAFRCDFEPHLRSLRVIDLTGDAPEEVADVDLRPAIRAFCESEPLDPDCQRSDLEVLAVEILAAPPLALLGVPFSVEVRTTFANQGPSTPIDATLHKDATAGGGAAVTPEAVQQDEPGLALAVEEIDDASYEVLCSEPSGGSVEFVSTLELLTVAATDPDPSNNDGTLLLDLDCAVPVSIVIKPSGSPNPFALPSGKIPVAVLSTGDGENGNPIAFDATAILVETVRFGPPEVLFGGGGSPESHGKLHPKDVAEPGARRGDGDVDVVLHFAVAGSGLSPSSQEGCVLGSYTLPGGGSAQFFGCDSLERVGGP